MKIFARKNLVENEQLTRTKTSILLLLSVAAVFVSFWISLSLLSPPFGVTSVGCFSYLFSSSVHLSLCLLLCSVLSRLSFVHHSLLSSLSPLFLSSSVSLRSFCCSSFCVCLSLRLSRCASCSILSHSLPAPYLDAFPSDYRQPFWRSNKQQPFLPCNSKRLQQRSYSSNYKRNNPGFSRRLRPQHRFVHNNVAMPSSSSLSLSSSSLSWTGSEPPPSRTAMLNSCALAQAIGQHGYPHVAAPIVLSAAPCGPFESDNCMCMK